MSVRTERAPALTTEERLLRMLEDLAASQRALGEAALERERTEQQRLALQQRLLDGTAASRAPRPAAGSAPRTERRMGETDGAQETPIEGAG